MKSLSPQRGGGRDDHGEAVRFFAGMIALAFLGAAVASAEGIWDNENLLADRPVRKHDLITVVRKAKEPAAKTPAEPDPQQDTDPAPKPDKEAEPAEKIAETETPFGDRFTARVIEVLPNGNLVLEARQEIREGETITEFVFSGEVSADAVSEDRTAPYHRVGETRIAETVRISGKKAQSRKESKGRRK